MPEYYANLFYIYIMPIMSLLSFFYIIYLLLKKQDIFYRIERDFFHTIENNKLNSNILIKETFEEIRNHNIRSLDEFNEQTSTILSSVKQDISQISQELKEVKKVQNQFTQILSEFQDINRTLLEEIKRRDATIIRKTKQIKRLKNEI